MKSINKKLEFLSKIALEDFDVDVLKIMRSEIKRKQESLHQKIDEINKSIKGANVYKEFYGKTKLLPDRFSTPLRRIISRQREIKSIRKYNSRYSEEIERLTNIINRKILDNKQNNKIGFLSFTKIKEGIIAFLIIIVLFLMSIEFFNNDLSIESLWKIFYLDAFCCFIFQLNFFAELILAPSKKWYIRNHWIDFITSIPIPSYEILRGGRAIRLFRLIRILRILRIIKVFRLMAYFWRGMDSISEILDVKLMKKTLYFSIGLLILGAFIISRIESNHGAIDSYKESLWWTFNAIVTGSFSDIYNPKTSGGMILTIVLVFVGMILVSVFTATLTSTMVGDDSNKSSEIIKSYVENRLNEIEKKIDRISKKSLK